MLEYGFEKFCDGEYPLSSIWRSRCCCEAHSGTLDEEYSSKYDLDE